ncbi:hypothetical protein CLCAR_3378 [Clostridium carboxidivorans P7]|nr:hypothetical protein CLCAR_3378 [Clostridium carboxidivorans P7]
MGIYYFSFLKILTILVLLANETLSLLLLYPLSPNIFTVALLQPV